MTQMTQQESNVEYFDTTPNQKNNLQQLDKQQTLTIALYRIFLISAIGIWLLLSKPIVAVIIWLLNPDTDTLKNSFAEMSTILSQGLVVLIILSIIAFLLKFSYNLIHYKKPGAFDKIKAILIVERFNKYFRLVTSKIPYSSNIILFTSLTIGSFILAVINNPAIILFTPVFLLITVYFYFTKDLKEEKEHVSIQQSFENYSTQEYSQPISTKQQTIDDDFDYEAFVDRIVNELNEKSAVSNKVETQLRNIFFNILEKYKRGNFQLDNFIIEAPTGVGRKTVSFWISRFYAELILISNDSISIFPKEKMEALIEAHQELNTANYIVQNAKDTVTILLTPPIEKKFLNALMVSIQEFKVHNPAGFVVAVSPDELKQLKQIAPDFIKIFYPKSIKMQALSPEELTIFFKKLLTRNNIEISRSALKLFSEEITRLALSPSVNWKGTAEVRRIFDLAFSNHKLEDLITVDIIKESIDILINEHRQRIAGEIPHSGKSKEQLWDEVDNIVGLNNAKEQLKKFIAISKLNKRKQKDGLKTTMPAMHMIFSGNPGTGKTTFASYVAAICREEGLLTQGSFKAVTEADLVSGYVGQTSPKTLSTVREMKGGVLLIDEAYSLAKSPNGGANFGQEAIDTLVGEIEKPEIREDMIVILAGYDKDMDRLLQTNAGLSSRFNNKISFEDYNVDELFIIAKKMIKDIGLEFDNQEVEVFLQKVINKIYMTRNKEHWGNARDMRNLTEKIQAEKALREMHQDTYDDIITKDDIKKAVISFGAIK